MSLQYTILGLLSWQPLSGYDLKKLIAESDLYPWAGSSNQIYYSLVQLHNDGLVTLAVHTQTALPDKKVYTLTPAGKAALRTWVLSKPELPELRNTFLIQLAWADQLTAKELNALLERYEDQLEDLRHIRAENAHRGVPAPARTKREQYLWDQIAQHIVHCAQSELDWVRRLRRELKEMAEECTLTQ